MTTRPPSFGPDTDRRLAKLTRWMHEASTVVWFTGAGISTDSGLPDYRGPDGAWTRQERGLPPPRPSKPLAAIRPNAAHHAIVQFEKLGKCAFLISQNVDDLHLESGYPFKKLAELHGNKARVRCQPCDRTLAIVDLMAAPKRRRTRRTPNTSYECPQCGGPLVRSVINFGDKMPEADLRRSYEWAERCDLFIVVGSSCQVSPASDIPRIAKRHGSRLAIINVGETNVDRWCDLRFREERAGEVLPELVHLVMTRGRARHERSDENA